MPRRDPRNEVWLSSGLPMKGMLDTIAEAVPGVVVVANNGCSIKTMESEKTLAMLVDMVANLNFTWKGPCIEILTTCVWPFYDQPDPIRIGLTTCLVRGTHTRLVCQGMRRLDRLAFLDRANGRLSRSPTGTSSSSRSAKPHL